MVQKMARSWNQRKIDWLEKTNISNTWRKWAISPLEQIEDQIRELQDMTASEGAAKRNNYQIDESLKRIKRDVKTSMSALEAELDDLALSSPDSYKLQISVPKNVNYLMKAWAAAEGRDLSGIALHCLEIGLRELKSNGSIPNSAIKRYNNSCEKRLALAEVNSLWEKHERESLRGVK